MEVQLQELIDKIKKDGLEEASKSASEVKAKAEAEAKKIVEDATKEAESLRAAAKADAERTEKAGLAAVAQASRNVILAFKGEVQALLDKIIADETAKALSPELLKDCLPEILKSLAASTGTDALNVLVSEAKLKELEAFFGGKLATVLKGGVELRGERSLGAGFRIAAKDGSAYYDFSAEAVADMFSVYLNPRLAEALKTGA
jgi:V/A-type H+-transporting ATPase subunit E